MSRRVPARLTTSALTAHNSHNGTGAVGSLPAPNGTAPNGTAPNGTASSPLLLRSSRSGSVSSGDSSATASSASYSTAASDLLVKPKYEMQLRSQYGRITQRNPPRSEDAQKESSLEKASAFSANVREAPLPATADEGVMLRPKASAHTDSARVKSYDAPVITPAPYTSKTFEPPRAKSLQYPTNNNHDSAKSTANSFNREGSHSSFSSVGSSNSEEHRPTTSYRAKSWQPSTSNSGTLGRKPIQSSSGNTNTWHPSGSRYGRQPSASAVVLGDTSVADEEIIGTTIEARLSSRNPTGSSESRASSTSSKGSSSSGAGIVPPWSAGQKQTPSFSAKPVLPKAFEMDDSFVILPPSITARQSRESDEEVFSEIAPNNKSNNDINQHHVNENNGPRSTRNWSTYKPPSSATARAMARAAIGNVPANPSGTPSAPMAPATPPAVPKVPPPTLHRALPQRASVTPTRTEWTYRQGGVLVQEVDEGQPCLTCHEKCPGFTPHMWRKTCSSCKCPREAHDVVHEEWVNVRERLGFDEPATGAPGQGAGGGQERSRAEGYAWVPPGLPSHKIETYFSQLPAGKVPKLSSAGEKYRDRQLLLQLPKQDLALAYCKHVEAQHSDSYEDFIAARNEIALDIGYVTESQSYGECPQCQQTVDKGDVVVIAPKLGPQTTWHPACFTCCSCQELLVDLTYCVHDDQLYCERHYAEQLKPRCAACDELIFSGEYTKAMNKDWHSGHFCCWQCDESLTGQRYVLRDDHPYCIKCYESVFANMCEECNRTIGIDSKDLSYKDKHWHEACFLCTKCRVSLVDKQFGSKADKIYCGNCYDAQFASRCDGCGEIFRAGTKKMEYKTRQWHEKCFCCCVCKTAIGTKSFIPREQEIYCAGCYEEKFATRCVKCNKIITSGGVTYKNEPWHRECFTCTHCNTSLAGQRFTSRDEKPYCADCFGELFAKRCTACSKPITGIGGTRFISFEDRHWHNDCFICASCKTSLVGRGFITDADDIICPECAKQKLM